MGFTPPGAAGGGDHAALAAASLVWTASGHTSPAGSLVAGFAAGVATYYIIGADIVPASRLLTAGAGLTGGGDLSADRTFNVGANADGSIVVNADDVQIGVLATDAQHGVRGGGTQHALVIAAGAAGFMSGADKTKLDGLTPGAAVASVTATAPVNSSGGANPDISLTFAAPTATSVATAPSAGVAVSAARSDHVHQSNTAPADVTKAAAAIGTSGEPARADHKHDVTTAAPGTIAVGDAAAEGVATSLARSDHTHALPAPAAPATIGTANATGAATTAARADHVHDHGAQTSGTLHAIATALVAGFMSAADFTKLANIATGASRAILVWGNNSIAATTTTRFLSAGFDSALASTTEIPVPLGSAGVLRNLYVRHNTATGNGNNVVYTVMVNGLATTLTVTLATNAIGQASDTTHTVTVAAGDRVSIQVTKAASVGTAQTDVTASFEVGAA